MTEIIVRAAARAVAEEASPESLITITDSRLSKDGKTLSLLINVIPKDKEHPAIVFLNRKQHDVFEYVKKHTDLSFIPKIVFEINEGEKNRQRLDALVAEDAKKSG